MCRSVQICVVGLALFHRALSAAPAQGSGDAYEFTLGGAPYVPEVFSLNGTPERPQAGDVIEVAGMLLTLGPELRCAFRALPEDGEADRIVLVRPNGKEIVVGARIRWDYGGENKRLVDPLAALSDAEIAGLWGVTLESWSDDIASRVAKIDPKRVCLTVGDDVAGEGPKALPPLPRDIAYLSVREDSNRGIEDYQSLKALNRLKFLELGALGIRSFDARLLGSASELSYLSLRMQTVAHAEALGALENLRVLDLARSEGITDLSFAAKLKRLRRLDVSRSEVEDLSPLAGLEDLVWVKANMTPVRRLPAGALPSLVTLGIMVTALTTPAVESFKQRNPRCAVKFRLIELFRTAVAGATRLAVRGNGLYAARGRTLFEVSDAEEVKIIVERTEINEAGSGFRCNCLGDPALEFYCGDTLLARLTLHHGQSLRWWSDGWPGDAMLTPASAKFYGEWLQEHGVSGPAREQAGAERRRAAFERRSRIYGELLAAAPGDLRTAKSDADFMAALEKNVPDAVDRAVLCFKLFGCDDGSWNLYAGLDNVLKETLLPNLPKEAVIAAATKVTGDAVGANGAARWLFGCAAWRDLGTEALGAVVASLATRALAHPREIARRRTLAALGEIKTGDALELLRTVLAGRITVRELPAENRDEPGGMEEFGPGDGEIDGGVTDRAYAALLLGKCGDRQSTAAIKGLAEKAEGAEKSVLEKALKLLEDGR